MSGMNVGIIGGGNAAQVDSSGRLQVLATGSVGQASSVAINDGVTSTIKATVAQFHNTDNQVLASSAYGLLQGGVAQLISLIGSLDRQRETGADNVPATGLASGSQQLASPFSITTTTSITLNQQNASVTLSAASGTNRGAPWTIVAGTLFVVAPGTASAEYAVVSAITGTTATLQFAGTNNGARFAHSGTTTLNGFTYNQARDATVPDGSTGAGFAAGATYLYNAQLNSGAGGWESERSANGELDGASGAGTNVAAEYEFNGSGPGGGSFDRGRNLQGKGIGSGTITTATQGTASLVLSASPSPAVQPGQQIFLCQSATNLLTGAATEVVYVSATYVSGATIALQSNIVNTGHTIAAWSTFSTTGPGTSAILPDGIGCEADVVYDPTTGMYAEEYAYTQDGMALKNVETVGLMAYNGTTADRIRKDAYTAGPAWVTHGGASTFAVTGTTGLNIKSSPGRLVRVIVTTTGSAVTNIYDNATNAASGTIIGVIPAASAVGTNIEFNMPAAVGIACPAQTNAAAFTAAIY